MERRSSRDSAPASSQFIGGPRQCHLDRVTERFSEGNAGRCFLWHREHPGAGRHSHALSFRAFRTTGRKADITVPILQLPKRRLKEAPAPSGPTWLVQRPPRCWALALPVLLSKFWAVPGQLSQNCEDTAPSSGLHAAGRSCAGAAAAREEGASSAPALTSPAEGPGHWLLDPPIFPLSHGSYNYIILVRKETYHLNKLSLQRGNYWTQSGDGTSKVTQRVTCE